MKWTRQTAILLVKGPPVQEYEDFEDVEGEALKPGPCIFCAVQVDYRVQPDGSLDLPEHKCKHGRECVAIIDVVDGEVKEAWPACLDCKMDLQPKN